MPRLSVETRAWAVQGLTLALVAAVLLGLGSFAAHNLARQGIASGFAFLGREAGFDIGDAVIPYAPTDHYLRAFAVGLLNTLRVAGLGIVLATMIGLIVGLARLSGNRLLAAMARGYVEALRNVPLLLQLFFWYAVTKSLPPPHEALQPFAGVFLTNRGIWLPSLFETPELGRFNVQGGLSMGPEFAALLTGLTLYTAAFIAEIVRGGIQGVERGQREAAAALGLSAGSAMRFVVLPQALRLIVPPLTSQYLNLIKNSSLAVAIGYPDLVSVANTTINQTGQAVEGVTIIMAVYLTLSLSIAGAMHFYNRQGWRR